MVNSLTDLIQDAVWNMVKNDWRTVMYWTWNTGIPCAVALLIGWVGSFEILIRIDYTRWIPVTLIFVGMNILGIASAWVCMVLQERLLHRLGKPAYFDQWKPTPGISGQFIDHEDEF